MNSTPRHLLTLIEQWYRGARRQSDQAVTNLEEATGLIEALTKRNTRLLGANASLQYELDTSRLQIKHLEQQIFDLKGLGRQ